MSKITYDEALAQLPKGWALWGNHGDGKWRAGMQGENQIVPARTLEEALIKAKDRASGAAGVLSINPSTREFQLAGQQATDDGHQPGSGSWWAALRKTIAAWQGTSSESACFGA